MAYMYIRRESLSVRAFSTLFTGSSYVTLLQNVSLTLNLYTFWSSILNDNKTDVENNIPLEIC